MQSLPSTFDDFPQPVAFESQEHPGFRIPPPAFDTPTDDLRMRSHANAGDAPRPYSDLGYSPRPASTELSTHVNTVYDPLHRSRALTASRAHGDRTRLVMQLMDAKESVSVPYRLL